MSAWLGSPVSETANRLIQQAARDQRERQRLANALDTTWASPIGFFTTTPPQADQIQAFYVYEHEDDDKGYRFTCKAPIGISQRDGNEFARKCAALYAHDRHAPKIIREFGYEDYDIKTDDLELRHSQQTGTPYFKRID